MTTGPPSRTASPITAGAGHWGGVHPSMLSDEVLAPIMSEANYKQLAARGQIHIVRQGKGKGN